MSCSIEPYRPGNSVPIRNNNSSQKPPNVISGQPDRPQLTKLQNGHYRVSEPWKIKLNGRVWDVPKGYSSNGITAPDYIKSSLGDGVDYPETWSAVYHDWLFTQPGITRQEADRLFEQLLLAYGVSAQKARMMYSVVARYSASKEQSR
ncbi:DUF1353 domain-containing protein [Luteolibacter sp. AS25]|uniref:DUF1353 domain-containing protein n=1 Tax=Luteolibacter sp. AS25 TaxID=3135776 RepID=UPI00398A5618